MENHPYFTIKTPLFRKSHYLIKKNKKDMNPLLEIFETPYGSAPFSRIENSHYVPAFTQAIEEAKQEIDAIVSNPDAPTFENTIVALDFSGQRLDRISSILFNLNSAETSPEIQKIAQTVSPLLSAFSNDITLNQDLFKRVQKVYEQKESLSLNTEESTLLAKKYKGFVRNGANLSEADKTTLRAIDADLSQKKLQFGENALADSNAFELVITEESQLKGLPEGAKEAAKQMATQKEKEGYVFTLDYPSYIPFMTYVEDRALREKMAKAMGAKGFQDNANNNEPLVKDIVRLRHQRANLLGYDTHADFVLEERMAKDPATVTNFLEDLLEKAKPAAEKQFAQLKDIAAKDGVLDFQKWDSAYYSEKLKKQLFDLDQEKLKPYFSLDKVLNGAFTIATKLFGLHFTQIETVDTYNEEVCTYKVTDSNGEYVSLFYTDFHPRQGKRNGAWMTSYKSQWKKDGENSRPHISIVCNFTKPTETKPSLLTFNEVTTLFHEFGHALHGMLADTTFSSLSGTNVYWDFVELPSQILENWCYEEEALELFAHHYKTGALIPMDLVTKIKESASFLEGVQTLRQISFGLLDMSWHGTTPSSKAVKEIELEAFSRTNLYPDVTSNCMSTAFSHIFSGGYSSGYYSYKWAEVLDADAFAYFKQEGIFNKSIATKFKDNILSQGGTKHPMDSYVAFRGAKPDSKSLLKRAGLLHAIT